MKSKKKVNIYKNDNKRFILVFTMMICLVISMITYWIYAYYHKYGYLPNESNLVSYKTSNYIDIEGDKMLLKNIDKNTSEDFLDKQNKILQNKVIDTDISKEIYNNILSIKIEYTIGDNNTSYKEVVALNYNLKENKTVNNENLLKMTSKSYKDIATEIFDDYIKLSNLDSKVVDAINDKELTGSEFNSNKEKYIVRIRERLPEIINMYIDDNKLYYVVDLYQLNDVCYSVKKESNTHIINKEIGKI